MATKKSAETEIVKEDANKSLVTYDYGDDEGKGYEHQTKADSSIPFVNLLQALSPIVVAEKAKAGQFYNTVTEQIWNREQGLLVVPATTRHVFSEWTPREVAGGGYRGQHEVESPIVQKAIKESAKFGKYKTDEGNILTETFYVYWALCDEDGNATSMAVSAYWSTKIKPYKAWMTRIRQMSIDVGGRRVRPPLYGNLTRLTAQLTQNAEGKQFYIPKMSAGDPRGLMQSLLAPDDERFLMAKACKELVDAGEAKVDYSKQDQTSEEGAAPF